MIALATFADGPYWRSALELLVYPSGCSFYRAFSYREDYVEGSLLERFRPRPMTVVTPGVIGLRFRDSPDHRASYVPLRLIDLVHVTTSDSVQVFFRLKDFIDLTPANRFQVLDLSGTIDVGPEAKLLMFPISDETIERLHVRATPPSKLWDRLTDDSALPPTALRNFAGSLVLRIESLTAVSTGVALQPKRLEYRSHRSTWGFELRAHETYECSFAYNRLKQGDAEVRSRFNYAFASPPEFFETSLPIVPVYGGYRRDSLWITPLKGLPAPVFLEWHGAPNREEMGEPGADGEGATAAAPEKEGLSVDSGTTAVREEAVPVFLNVLSVERTWSRARITYALLAVVFLCAAGLFVRMYFTFKPELKSAFSGLAAASLSIAVSFFKDVVKVPSEKS